MTLSPPFSNPSLPMPTTPAMASQGEVSSPTHLPPQWHTAPLGGLAFESLSESLFGGTQDKPSGFTDTHSLYPTRSTLTLEALTEGLNPQQHQAVTHGEGALLVLAGAGSGKTSVLTKRIGYLLARPHHPEQACSPYQILAVTFTNKAAREMQERLGQLVGEETAKRLWVGTFHSICAKILRGSIQHYAPPSGRRWDQRFVIYDTDDSLSVIKDALKRLQLDDKAYPPRMVKDQISQLKNVGMDAHSFSAQAKGYQAERLASLYDQYERLLCENNALDFDDLLLITVRLLMNHPETLSRYHQQFRHVLVDEFQDTNAVQYHLIKLLATGDPQAQAGLPSRSSLTVVGDVDQSIYSWRGANFRIILGFQKDFAGCELIKLELNYRSTQHILEAANAIIEHNKERLPKTLKSTQGKGHPLYLFEATDDYAEAQFVIDRLQAMCHDGYTPNECAILYRTNAQSRMIEDLLMARGMAYQLIGGMKFYERKEIRDMMAYLTLLFNPADAYSLKRALGFPKRGIGKTSLEKLELLASQQGVSLFEAMRRLQPEDGILKGKQWMALTRFIEQVIDMQTAWESGRITRVDQLLMHIRQTVSFDASLREDDPTEAEDRLENVEEFIQVAFQFHQTYDTEPDSTPADALGAFLAKMALLSDLDQDNPAERIQRFTLMTVHAAKGLEFPVVILTGLEEGTFPHQRSLDKEDQMEEERRLMYVAVTRAKQRLFMAYARARYRYGEMKYASPSRFLKEIPAPLLTGQYALDRYGEATAQSRYEYDTERSRYKRESVYDEAESSRFQRKGEGSSTYASGPKRFGKAGTSSHTNYQGKQEPRTSTRTIASHTPSQPLTTETFAKGDRVCHEAFGEGTIDQLMGVAPKTMYSIQFDRVSGKKLIDPRYTKLTRA
ncbi:MAG: ATP-dependent helicase [Vampirovibrionales bacterium]